MTIKWGTRTWGTFKWGQADIDQSPVQASQKRVATLAPLNKINSFPVKASATVRRKRLV